MCVFVRLRDAFRLMFRISRWVWLSFALVVEWMSHQLSSPLSCEHFVGFSELFVVGYPCVITAINNFVSIDHGILNRIVRITSCCGFYLSILANLLSPQFRSLVITTRSTVNLCRAHWLKHFIVFTSWISHVVLPSFSLLSEDSRLVLYRQSRGPSECPYDSSIHSRV